MGSPTQRGGQRHDPDQRQTQIPHLSLVVRHQFHQAGHTQSAGQNDVLGKDGQTHIADELPQALAQGGCELNV